MRVIVHQAQTCDDFEIYDNNKIQKRYVPGYQLEAWNTPLPLGLRNIRAPTLLRTGTRYVWW